MQNSTPSYLEIQLNLLKRLVSLVEQTEPFTSSPLADNDDEFLQRLRQLVDEVEKNEGDYLFLGQQVVTRIITAYPHLTPSVPRDLLWFFGGDCLHYMPDDEIEGFQRLEDMRHDAESQNQSFDWEQARATILKLH